MNTLKLLLCISCTLIVVSCANIPQQSASVSPAVQQQLLEFDQWHIKGKLGYKSLEQSGSAWFDWQQQQQDFELSLRGPFGVGTTYLSGSPQQATLLNSKGETFLAPSAALLSQKLFGWQWPVEELLYWVRGIASPNLSVEAAIYNELHQLEQLDQAGWQLRFSDYQVFADSLVLPNKIKGQFQDVSFTLLVKERLAENSHD